MSDLEIRIKESGINLYPMDRFTLMLFPDSKIYPDGVECDFDELKYKTMELIRSKFSSGVVGCYFNLHNIEYWNKDGFINVIDYNSL